MPVYEYKCKSCGEKFEVYRYSTETEADKITCPRCGAENIERVYSICGAVPSKGSCGSWRHT